MLKKLLKKYVIHTLVKPTFILLSQSKYTTQMSESQLKVMRRKRESYRTGQTNPYKLRDEYKRMILEQKELFRFVEDYFHISKDAVYRYIKTNDPCLTQIGFLQHFAERLEGVGLFEYESLIEKNQ